MGAHRGRKRRVALSLVPALALLGPVAPVALAAAASALPASGSLVPEPLVATPRPAVQPQFAVTTKSLPEATDGLEYSANLATAGATGYCAWTLVKGYLPRGLEMGMGLGCQAQVVGTPVNDEPRVYSFKFEVFDFIGDYATTTLSIRVVAGARGGRDGGPAPRGGAGKNSELSLHNHTASRPNWSGYVVGDGPYTQMQGTFTVPYITGHASCSQQLGEWVGFNGANTLSRTAGTSLIQAGVGESMDSPYSGTCKTGQFYLWGWWEVLPRPETWISAVTVDAGDQVTIDIQQLAPQKWEISFRDDTNGESFNTVQRYSMKPTTAEWIVEATEIPSLCGVGVDPSLGPGICQLAPFAPDVAFNHLGTIGHKREIWRVNLVQDGSQLSTPSPFASGGFDVDYTGK